MKLISYSLNLPEAKALSKTPGSWGWHARNIQLCFLPEFIITIAVSKQKGINLMLTILQLADLVYLAPFIPGTEPWWGFFLLVSLCSSSSANWRERGAQGGGFEINKDTNHICWIVNMKTQQDLKCQADFTYVVSLLSKNVMTHRFYNFLFFCWFSFNLCSISVYKVFV